MFGMICRNFYSLDPVAIAGIGEHLHSRRVHKPGRDGGLKGGQKVVGATLVIQGWITVLKTFIHSCSPPPLYPGGVRQMGRVHR